MEIKNIAVLIPCYEADGLLKKTVDGVIRQGFEHVVVVDDGSSYATQKYFDELDGAAAVIHHHTNLGKGMALKTGIEYCMNEGYAGVVTIDADGQHAPEDVRACADALRIWKPDSLIVGCRDFDARNVPFKSRWGNKITRMIFATCGIHISDTQTGLRAFSAKLFKLMLGVPGSRYEYETNVLLECHKNNIAIDEVKIQTIYLDENRASHFHPVRDGVMIYSTLLKYAAGSMMAAAVDISMFWVFGLALAACGFPEAHKIVTASFLARAVSSLVNYKINQKLVFHSAVKAAIFRYYALCVVQIVISALTVSLISTTLGLAAGGQTGIKALVDFMLFFISYKVQKKYVF